MARSVKDAKLETRTQRLKLKKGKRHWKAISRGLALGYWRGVKSTSWLVKKHHGNNKYELATLDGKPDDYEDADGAVVLDFYQAQDAAREWANVSHKRPYTVTQAVADYLEDFDRKSLREWTRMCNTYILSSKLADKLVADLEKDDIRKWHHALKKAKPKGRPTKEGKVNYRHGPVDERKRKATAKKILGCLRAVLNHAYDNGKVPSKHAWETYRGDKNVDAPRVHFLGDDACRRLVNSCDPEFRPMVLGALFTGGRYGELCNLKVGDYNAKGGTIYIEPSKGRARHCYLTDEGRQFFDRMALNRNVSEHMFLRDDGTPWRRGQQKRRMQAASEGAKIDPPATFHILRHSYGSRLAQQAVPIQIIAEALGHSNTQITVRHYAHLMPSHVAQTIRGALPTYGFEQDNVTVIGNRR